MAHYLVVGEFGEAAHGERCVGSEPFGRWDGVGEVDCDEAVEETRECYASLATVLENGGYVGVWDREDESKRSEGIL